MGDVARVSIEKNVEAAGQGLMGFQGIILGRIRCVGDGRRGEAESGCKDK